MIKGKQIVNAMFVCLARHPWLTDRLDFNLEHKIPLIRNITQPVGKHLGKLHELHSNQNLPKRLINPGRCL